jgi:hypothetical protein
MILLLISSQYIVTMGTSLEEALSENKMLKDRIKYLENMQSKAKRTIAVRTFQFLPFDILIGIHIPK